VRRASVRKVRTGVPRDVGLVDGDDCADNNFTLEGVAGIEPEHAAIADTSATDYVPPLVREPEIVITCPRRQSIVDPAALVADDPGGRAPKRRRGIRVAESIDSSPRR